MNKNNEAAFLTISARIRGLVILAVILFPLMFARAVEAATWTNADAIFAAYNQAFYFTNGDKGFFHDTTEGGKTFFWDRAEEMEMVLDVYERTSNHDCLTQFTQLFNGFIADHGSNWSHNDFNDDIMWMVIACARAHELSGNAVFRDLAKSNFDMCYARAWSTNLGGGLWWKITNHSKNACVNGPAAIAAYLLYQIYGDTNYLAKSRDIYEWERKTLFNSETGQVYDNLDISGRLHSVAFTYNEGTFIGAANFLGATNDAKLAADFTKNTLSKGGLMPSFGQRGDAAGFNGICDRWLARFMRDRGLQASYQKWLQANAEGAWNNRRLSDNLSWSRLDTPTPSGPLKSWGCSSAVVIMQVVPPAE